jgi:hypothetical protein
MRRSVSAGREMSRKPVETGHHGRSDFEFGPYFRASSCRTHHAQQKVIVDPGFSAAC